jgi:hypothetical protein
VFLAAVASPLRSGIRYVRCSQVIAKGSNADRQFADRTARFESVAISCVRKRSNNGVVSASLVFTGGETPWIFLGEILPFEEFRSRRIGCTHVIKLEKLQTVCEPALRVPRAGSDRLAAT